MEDEKGNNNTSKVDFDDSYIDDEVSDDISVLKSATKPKKWFGIVTRSLPKQLFVAIKGMYKRQRECVKNIGFGKLLSFNVNGIPAKKMDHFVVDNFDSKRMLIAAPKGSINIDVNSIHNLLRLPNGGIQISNLTKPEEYSEAYLLWRELYGRRSISPTDIVRNISVNSYDDELIFKLDFLVLFLTTMVVGKMGYASME
ncbi:hypothetical protein E3N88_09671 [Mikania micrantha]|uniref:Uncharacterized protein n=1 Tax=Mikania micrantha TaxID=192012 RepID=A0A5N6PMT7_9ASTR|nr:hypothetical protein E3N88_09671 [Mikania micrantha]